MFKYIFTFGFIISFSIIIAQPRFINPTLPARCAGTNQTDSLTGLTNGQDYVITLMPGNLDTIELLNVTPNRFFSFPIPLSTPQGNSYYFIIARKSAIGTTLDTSDRFRIDQRISFTPTITASPTTICSGGTVAFSLSHNSSPFTYTLDYGDGTPRDTVGLSKNKTYTLSTFGSGSTSYRAIYTVDNGTCPSKSDSVRITVKEKPTTNLGLHPAGSTNWSMNIGGGGDTTFTLCNSSGITDLNLLKFGDQGTVNNYLFNWGDTTSNTYSSFPSPFTLKTYSSLGSKNLLLTLSGTNGCSNTLQYGIYIGSNPNVGIGNPGATTGGCIPQSYSFPITGTAINTPGTKYTIFSSDSMGISYTFNHPPPAFWNKNFAQSSCGFGPTPTGVNNSFYVQINASNACGTTQALISPIQIDEKPRAGFTILDPIICQNTSVSFQDRSINGRKVRSSNNTCDSALAISYLIYRVNVPGTLIGIINPGVVGGISSVNITQPGNYYAVQNVRNATGSCPASLDTQYFCVQSWLFPRFNSSANPSNSLAPVRYTLTNITDTLQTCNQKQWRWSVWDSLGTTQITSGSSGVTINNPTNANGDIQFSNPGKYVIRLSATNDCSLTIDTSMLINVLGTTSTVAEFSPKTGIDCNPKTITFSNQSSGVPPLSYQWTINNKSYTTANPTHTFTNSGVIDSTYFVRLIVTDGLGNKDTTIGNYTIFPNPKARFSALTTSACAPFRIDSLNIFDSLYTGTNGVYSWYVNGVLVGSPSATLTGFPGYTMTNGNDSVIVKLVVSSKFSCPAKDSMQMVFRTITNPVPNFTMSTNAGCEPLSITLTSTTNPPGVAHLWRVGNQATITSGSSTSNTTLTIQVNNPGTTNWLDSVRLNVTAGSGCSDSIKKAYTVYPKPMAGISSVDSICAAGVVNISHNGSTPPAINAYNWSITANTTPAAAITAPRSASTSITFPDQQGGSNQAIIVKQLVTTSQGCEDSVTKTIIMLTRPLANLTRSDSAICAPGSVNLANTNTIAGASYTWTYSSNPIGSNNNQTIVNPTAASTLVNFGDRKGTRDTLYTFAHIINDSRGCKDTATINVNVHPRPTAAFAPVTGIDCTPKLVAFTNSSSGQLGTSPYRWTINTTTYTSATPSHTFTNTGVIDSTYLTKLVVTSGFGCKDSTTGNYTIHPNPKARFSATNTAACAPFRIDSLNIFDSLYTGTNGVYSWYFNGVLAGTPSASSTGFPGYTISNANDSVIVKLVVSSKFSCPAKDSMQMVFRTITNPVPNFTMSTNAGCEPLIITLTSTTNPPGVAHLWRVGNQATITSGSSTSNATLTIQVNNPGITNWLDSVRLNVTAGSGCSDSIKKAYTVYPKPVAGIASADSICAAGVVNISHNGSTPPAISTYNWSITANTTPAATIAAPSSASTFITFPDQQNGSNQSIMLRQIVTTSNGCKDTISKIITMLPRPLGNLTRSDSAICAPGSVTLANTNTIAGASYTWTYSSNPIGSNNNQTIVNPTAASTLVNFGDRKGTRDTLYTFAHIINDSRGCKDTATINVNVHPRPNATFTPLTGTACTPSTVSFSNTSTGQVNAGSYSWNINNRAYTSLSPSHTFTNTGVIDSTYLTKLVVTSGFGCKDSTTGNYTINPNPKARFSAINVTNSPPFQIDSLNINDSLYTGTNGIYTWYVNGSIVGTPSASSTGFPGYTIFNGNDSAIVKLVVSSKFGCSSKDSMQLIFRTSQNTGGVVSPLSYLKFNYQGSLYTSNGQLYANKGIGVKFTITDSTATNYIETQSITTDFKGHFATKVGDGTSLLGSLADIPWWDGKGRYLTTQIDTNSTGNWISMGQSELISVPYAFYAMRSGDGSRTLFGSFDTNGNTLSGRGFTVRFIGGNRYEINFLQPFSEMPYINVKLIGNGTYSDKIISKTNQRTTIEITGNPDQIQFEAMGR